MSVDFSGMPPFADEQSVRDQARAIKDAGERAVTTATDCQTKWNGLTADVYDSPHRERVVTAWVPVVASAEAAEETSGEISNAMSGFADQIAGFKSRLDALGADPLANACFSPEYEEENRDRFAALQGRINALALEYHEAALECGARIRNAAGMTPTSNSLVVPGIALAQSAIADQHKFPRVPTVDVRTLPTTFFDPSKTVFLDANGIPKPPVPGFQYVDDSGRTMRTVAGAPPVVVRGRPATPRPATMRPPVTMPEPPRWATRTGRALSAAGGVVTVWDSYSSQYNDDLANNPGMGDGERQFRAVSAGAIEGGTSVAGGLAGAWAGAKGGAVAGAWIGSFFGPGPGTAVGAAVGGIIGAVGGGIVGSGIGKEIGSGIKDAWNGLWD